MIEGRVLENCVIETRDGRKFCFDECNNLPFSQHQGLFASGCLYLTEFWVLDQGPKAVCYGGSLIAMSWADAEEEAQRRGIGERVIGVAHAVIPWDGEHKREE